MSTEAIVALLGVVVAAATFVVGVLYQRKQQQGAEEQAELERQRTRLAEEQAELERQRTRLAEEQAELERQRTRLAEEQARRDETRFLEERQARLSAEWVEGPVEKQGGYEYSFNIRNRGKELADNPTVWLADQDEKEVTDRLNFSVLREGGEQQIRLLARTVNRPLRLHFQWWDSTGEHHTKSRVSVPLD